MGKPDIYYSNAAKQWIIRAKDDILWTENNIRGGFYTQACFTAQQVAEKSLKAFLRRRGKEIDKEFKTHQLINLLHQCSKIEKEFNKFEKHCRILNEFYAPTRYPEILGLDFRGYEEEQAQEALSLSKEILEFAGEKIREVDNTIG